jgi:hypothetical protein
VASSWNHGDGLGEDLDTDNPSPRHRSPHDVVCTGRAQRGDRALAVLWTLPCAVG